MRADLDRHGVLVAIEAPTDAPTTLALVDVDPAGVPGYHFYLAGASAAAVGPSEAVPPAGTGTEQLVAELPGGVTVMLDPNCPAAVQRASSVRPEGGAELVDHVRVAEEVVEEVLRSCAEVNAPVWCRDRPPGVQQDRAHPWNGDVRLARNGLGRRAEVAWDTQDVGDVGRLGVRRGRAGERIALLRVAPELMDDPLRQDAAGVVVAGGYLADDALVIDDLTVAAGEIGMRINRERTAALTDGSVFHRLAGEEGRRGRCERLRDLLRGEARGDGREETASSAVSSAVNRTGCRMRIMS
jgi:hypothetical protein